MLLLLKSNLKCNFCIVQFTTCVPVAGCQFVGMIMPTKLCFFLPYSFMDATSHSPAKQPWFVNGLQQRGLHGAETFGLCFIPTEKTGLLSPSY